MYDPQQAQPDSALPVTAQLSGLNDASLYDRSCESVLNEPAESAMSGEVTSGGFLGARVKRLACAAAGGAFEVYPDTALAHVYVGSVPDGVVADVVINGSVLHYGHVQHSLANAGCPARESAFIVVCSPAASSTDAVRTLPAAGPRRGTQCGAV